MSKLQCWGWRLAVVWMTLYSVGSAQAQTDGLRLAGLLGSAVGPLTPTSVEMQSQQVLLTIIETTFTTNYGQAGFLTGVGIVAEYTFFNPTTEATTHLVGIPLNSGLPPGVEGYYEIQSVGVQVGDVTLPTFITPFQDTRWMAWEMTFAAGEQTQLRVNYEVPATVIAPLGEVGYQFGPMLSWAGETVETEVALRFPYPIDPISLSQQGLLFGTPGNVGSVTYEIEDTDLVWRLEAFTPDPTSQVLETFVLPRYWRSVIRAREALDANPIGPNYWQLAQAYAEIIRPEGGLVSPAVAEAADEAYLQARLLLPDSPSLADEYIAFVQQFGGNLLPDIRLTEIAPFTTQTPPQPTATATTNANITPTLPSLFTPTPNLTPATTQTFATPIATAGPSPTPDPVQATLQAIAGERAILIMLGLMGVALIALLFFFRRFRL